MSKSVKRVKTALADAGLDDTVMEMTVSTKSAQDAATAIGSDLDQIAKSIIMQGVISGRLYLFITAGGNRVCADRATERYGEVIVRADAALIRSHTGFAIGGVAPIGHLNPVTTAMDPRLFDFETVWAAGGTPRHMFSIGPDDLMRLSQAERFEFCEEESPL